MLEYKKEYIIIPYNLNYTWRLLARTLVDDYYNVHKNEGANANTLLTCVARVIGVESAKVQGRYQVVFEINPLFDAREVVSEINRILETKGYTLLDKDQIQPGYVEL